MEKNKISVIIANYNNAKYITSTINSILNQTYKNIEIIIVDDASTDKSKEIIKNYTKRYKNIKSIFLSNNKGAYYCRNEGLKIASGDFITLLDSDDVFLSNRLKNAFENYHKYKTNMKYGKEFEILFSKIYRFNHTEIKVDSKNYDKKILDLITNERKIYANKILPFKYKFVLGMATIFVKKDFFKKYGMWRDDYYYGMDAELIQRYLLMKYGKMINYVDLWNSIFNKQLDKYGIVMDNNMNYISQPMNKKNATLKCRGKTREEIHKYCENEMNSTFDFVKSATHKLLNLFIINDSIINSCNLI